LIDIITMSPVNPLRLQTAMTRSSRSFSGNIGSAAPRSWAASANKATTPPAASDVIVAISPEFPTTLISTTGEI
jgi:hypothetical protein